MKLDACGYCLDVIELEDQPMAPRRLLGAFAAQLREKPMLAQMYQGDAGVDLDLGEFGAFRAGECGRDEVEVQRWPIDASLRDEFLFGPVLLSALAARGIFALHASAFRLGADAEAPTLAVIAPSGTGKSTLARAACERGWERLSDDLLPTRIEDEAGPMLLPHFPQLKLSAGQQYPRQRPARVPLAALLVLERSDTTAIAPLPPKDVMQTVLSSTISSRLFPPAVLHRHWRFASAMAAAVAAGRLRALRLRVRDEPQSPTGAADQALSLLLGRFDHGQADR